MLLICSFNFTPYLFIRLTRFVFYLFKSHIGARLMSKPLVWLHCSQTAPCHFSRTDFLMGGAESKCEKNYVPGSLRLQVGAERPQLRILITATVDSSQAGRIRGWTQCLLTVSSKQAHVTCSPDQSLIENQYHNCRWTKIYSLFLCTMFQMTHEWTHNI